MKIFFSLSISCLLLSSCQTQTTVDLEAYTSELSEHRRDYLADFLSNPRSPLDSTDISDIHFYPIDPDYRCLCDLEQLKTPQGFKMSTYSGAVQDYLKYAVATCTISGQRVSIELYKSMRMLSMPNYRNRLFIPFRDHTNGDLTYGGGRYLDVVIDSTLTTQIVLDFNKVYNPWCAYSDGYSCPIPPIANHLDLPILAGEKNYTGTHKSRED